MIEQQEKQQDIGTMNKTHNHNTSCFRVFAMCILDKEDDDEESITHEEAWGRVLAAQESNGLHDPIIECT
eukprot:5381852-Amphidinium_carterae.2